jgi:hypothetical protein
MRVNRSAQATGIGVHRAALAPKRQPRESSTPRDYEAAIQGQISSASTNTLMPRINTTMFLVN